MMGLTIHYEIHAPHVASQSEARKLVAQLHRFAKTMPVHKCSGLKSWTRSKDDPREAMFHSYCLPTDDSDDPTHFVSAEPLELVRFSFNHPGAETAHFGLARYPEKISGGKRGGRKLTTGLNGWHWRNFCKTQYASLPAYGGWDHFFNIHDSICRTLDEAARLGLGVDVRDDGGYWKDRDAGKLRQAIDHWNTLIAAFAGKFKDAMGGKGSVVAPITEDPTFEQLEARGQKHFQKRRGDARNN